MVTRRYEIYVGEVLKHHHILDGVYAKHLSDGLKAKMRQDGEDPSIVKIRVIERLRTVKETTTKVYYI